MRHMARGVRIPLNIFQTYIYIYICIYVSLCFNRYHNSQLLFVISCCFNVVSMFSDSPCGIALLEALQITESSDLDPKEIESQLK